MTDVVLVLSWLVLAHLLADFVLQDNWIAQNKGSSGRSGWRPMAVHGLHVTLCLLPVALAYGPPGVAYIAVTVVSHVLVDRWKVRATGRAEERAQAQAGRRTDPAGPTPPPGLGVAWTPWPGILFLGDQALHLIVVLVGWLVLLQGEPLSTPFTDLVNAVFGAWDRAVVHAALLTGVVLISLFIVNTRAAYYFVVTLVSPRDLAPEREAASEPEPALEPVAAAAAPGYTVRLGPLVATVERGVAGVPHPAVPGTASPATANDPTEAPTALEPVRPRDPERGASVPVGAPARIGATIGALERLLIVVLVLTGAEAAVGLVIAAKTLARFKQLDDRGFAEYYLLGTLASVSVAIVSAIIALAALQTLP